MIRLFNPDTLAFMLNPLLNVLSARADEVAAWFDGQWNGLQAPVYLSCDIRHSGHKMAVVDTNLFPAGFNNLCKVFSAETAAAFTQYFQTHYPETKRILIYAEEHTRNKFYLKNVARLQKLLTRPGVEVVLGVLGSFLTDDKMDFVLDDNEKVTLNRLKREGDILKADGFTPDLVLSNNDFSGGLPEMLAGIAQPIIPSPHLGWHRRSKTDHFTRLAAIVEKFAQAFDLDPWNLSPYFSQVKDVDFFEEKSLQAMAVEVDFLIERIRKKYEQYGINESPYVYIKNDRGTYGLGILPVFSGEEVLSLNRRKKNKLLSSKSQHGQITQYLLQEGIPTADYYSGYPLEPVIYMVGRKDVGGFFRIHESKNELESLNAPGMTFSCLCMHKLDEPHESIFIDCCQKEGLVKASRFLGQLAALAAARE